MNEIIRSLSGSGTLTFAANVDNFEIRITTQNGKFSMKGINPDEYLALPELFESEKPEFQEITLQGENGEEVSLRSQNPNAAYFKHDELVRLAEKTYFAVSTDEYRPAMNGVLFRFAQDSVITVATDSYRLVKAICHSTNAAFPDDLDIIIPARTVDLMRKVEDDVILSVIETRGKLTHVRLDSGNTVIIARLIDEKFPPFETVIPMNNSLFATAKQNDLLSAVKRVAILTNKISSQVRLRIDDNVITIHGEDEDAGDEANETLPCTFTGDRFEIGFNYRFLDEAIQNVDSEGDETLVKFAFSETNRPAIILPMNDNEDLLMLIMPVRIGSN